MKAWLGVPIVFPLSGVPAPFGRAWSWLPPSQWAHVSSRLYMVRHCQRVIPSIRRVAGNRMRWPVALVGFPIGAALGCLAGVLLHISFESAVPHAATAVQIVAPQSASSVRSFAQLPTAPLTMSADVSPSFNAAAARTAVLPATATVGGARAVRSYPHEALYRSRQAQSAKHVLAPSWVKRVNRLRPLTQPHLPARKFASVQSRYDARGNESQERARPAMNMSATTPSDWMNYLSQRRLTEVPGRFSQ